MNIIYFLVVTQYVCNTISYVSDLDWQGSSRLELVV